MKKISKYILLLSLLSINVCSCKNSSSSTNSISSSLDNVVKVDKVNNAKTYFILDLYNSENVVIDANNYFSWNNNEVSFSINTQNNNIQFEKIGNEKFEVLPLTKGNAIAEFIASYNGETLASYILTFNISSSAPEAPIINFDSMKYDKAVGGKCEIPVQLNKGLPSLVKINNLRLPEENWKYDDLTRCLIINEDYMELLGKDNYDINFITTGGNVEFVLEVYNSIITKFDSINHKYTKKGLGNVIFNVEYSTAKVKKVTYGNYVLEKDKDYIETSSTLEIKEQFYMRTYNENNIAYKLYLTNNEMYEFYITNNQVFYTDYDVTTIHDSVESKTGLNSLYQDSTTVQIMTAPDNINLDGQVLKVTPYKGQSTLNTYGIYTIANGGTSTWYKLPFVNNGSYTISFDYVTENTKAGEDYRFRSWNGGIMGDKIITGQNGVKHHYSHTFKWNNNEEGIMLYGRFLNGGNIYIDNYSIVYNDYVVNNDASTSNIYLRGGRKEYKFNSSEDLNDFNFYSEIYNQGFYYNDNKLVARGICESKALLNYSLDDTFIISADFESFEKDCPIDAGFYFYASYPNNNLDGIKGYNINIEKNASNPNKALLKLHKFDYGYLGSLKETNIYINDSKINLKLYVNKENVKVYINNSLYPAMEVTLEDYKVGTIGFRDFRGRGIIIDNLSIESSVFPPNNENILSLLEKSNNINRELYESLTLQKLDEAITVANDSKNSMYQQKIDEAYSKLNEAYNNLLLKRTFQELNKKINDANILINEGAATYTYNTYRCLVNALNDALLLDERNSDYEISKAYVQLEKNINGLIKYSY